MRSGFVTVYGKANAGKSSILNRILGFKFEAVSERPQTTRENVLGIYNGEGVQICFIDTPGIFKPHASLGANLLRKAESGRRDCDALLFVFASDEGIDKDICEKVRTAGKPVVLAYNKIDKIRADEGENKLKKLLKLLPEDTHVIRCSARDNFGMDDIVKALTELLPEGEALYPDDIVSDRPREFVFAEFIREKCMRLLHDELPHSIYVEIKSVEEEDEGIAIRANILVERESEKAIVIGKRGAMIAKISKYSEDAIKGYVGKPVYVRLLVKVAPDWRNDDRFLQQHGLSAKGS